MPASSVVIRHWLPIVTFCPVNKLPDLLYVSLEFRGDALVELYQVRRTVRKLASWKLAFMEDIARMIQQAYPEAYRVQVRLAFSRHVVSLTNNDQE